MSPEFAKAVDPIVNLMVDYKELIERNSAPDVCVIRESLIERIVATEKTFADRHDEWGRAKYALICWIDEQLSKWISWPGAKDWENNPLERRFYSNQRGREQFFIQAAKARQLDLKDVMEVYFLCVVLGFKGVYDGGRGLSQPRDLELPDTLEEWVRTSRTSIKAVPATATLNSDPSVPTAKRQLCGKSQFVQTLVAFVVAVFVAIATICSSGIHATDQSFATWVSVMTGVIAVVMVVLGVCYACWLRGVGSVDSSIRTAWNQGIAELRRNGIKISDRPLYLVLGISDVDGADALMQASGLRLGVRPPEGRQMPLLWYTAEDHEQNAIFLFLCTCCQTGLLSAIRFPKGNHPGGISDQLSRTLNTISDVTSSFGIQDETPSEEFDVLGFSDVANSGDRVVDLNCATVRLAHDQLKYVSRLLRQARDPDYACEGVILTVPYALLREGCDSQCQVLGDLCRSDLAVLTRETGMRSHVISVVHGIERDRDFHVFVKRMREFQSSTDIDRRLGRGLPPWSDGTTEVVASVAEGACETVQRLIDRYLSTTQTLKKIDNGQLYRFLSRIRGSFCVGLKSWLCRVFVQSDRETQSHKANLTLPSLAGCYFLAAEPRTVGVPDDDRLFAHVPGVFSKLSELKEHVEWSASVLESDRRCDIAARIFFYGTLAVVAIWLLGLSGGIGF